MDDTSGIFHILLLSYVRQGLCDPFFFSSACAVRLIHSTKFMHSARPTMLCIHLHVVIRITPLMHAR